MVQIGTLEISPPFLNSSCPWASDLAQLEELYRSPHTGAVTTRTATLHGFSEDPALHTVAFAKDSYSSINSYGYSPLPLSSYLESVRKILLANPSGGKPFIVSITSNDPRELVEMLDMISQLVRELADNLNASSSVSSTSPVERANSLIAVELNTSCPNIPNKPPPAYHSSSLWPLLEAIDAFQVLQTPMLTLGLKLPPYVYAAQFVEVLGLLRRMSVGAVTFLTCTNTLGSAVLLADQANGPTSEDTHEGFALPTAFGGLAGDAIHPLSLGNVKSFTDELRKHPETQHMAVIGVGGVNSPESARRMFRVGAKAVACATALGKEGVGIFEKLLSGQI